MSEFVKYSSIENSYRQGYLDKCAMHVGDAQMVAVEKIHGANFSWITDGDTVRVASRNDLIDELETFYGHTRFYSRYKPVVQALFGLVKNEFPSVVQINLFGEIFGGRYNGVGAQSAKKVQDGVNYHPDNEFMAFDLKLTFDTGVSRYVPFMDLVEWLFDANFIARLSFEDRMRHAPIIKIGTLEELIKIDPLFYTYVPAAYGLETEHREKTPLDYAEGFVICGYSEDFYMGNERVILKQKNHLYGEKVKEVKIKSAVNLTDEQQDLLDKVCSYMNENRVRAVVSKSVYDQKSFGRLQGDFTRDALEDFEKDHGYKAQESEPWNVLGKRVGAHAAQIIKPVWLSLDFS